MSRLQLQDYYSTADLCQAVALSLYSPIDSLDRNNPSRIEFLFKRDEQLLILLEKYWKGELLVSPQAYFYQLKQMKTRIYAND